MEARPQALACAPALFNYDYDTRSRRVRRVEGPLTNEAELLPVYVFSPRGVC